MIEGHCILLASAVTDLVYLYVYKTKHILSKYGARMQWKEMPKLGSEVQVHPGLFGATLVSFGQNCSCSSQSLAIFIVPLMKHCSSGVKWMCVLS